MNKHRTLKLALGAMGAFLTVSALVHFVANATPPEGLSTELLARGQNISHGTIPLHVGSDVIMARITVQPGGSSGWHSHPGGAIIVVQTGSLTVYRSLGGQCQVETYGAGQAFIERPDEVDQVVNSGLVPYVVLVAFPNVPHGAPARTDLANPGTCAGV